MPKVGQREYNGKTYILPLPRIQELDYEADNIWKEIEPQKAAPVLGPEDKGVAEPPPIDPDPKELPPTEPKLEDPTEPKLEDPDEPTTDGGADL